MCHTTGQDVRSPFGWQPSQEMHGWSMPILVNTSITSSSASVSWAILRSSAGSTELMTVLFML